MDSIGTHLVENVIGIARQASSDPRFDRIMSTYAHAEIRKHIALKYGLVLHVSGRIGDAGCKCDRRSEVSIAKDLAEIPEGWSVQKIVNLFRALSNTELHEILEDEVHVFTDQMDLISHSTDRHEYDTNETANSGIIARLISFKQDPAKTGGGASRS